jgi:hypothetical protein
LKRIEQTIQNSDLFQHLKTAKPPLTEAFVVPAGLSSQNDRLVLLSRLDIELRVEIIRIRVGFRSGSDQ